MLHAEGMLDFTDVTWIPLPSPAFNLDNGSPGD